MTTTTQTVVQQEASKAAPHAITEKAPGHFGDWPNAAGFTTYGDQRDKIQLQVTGHIPEYAAGALYRTGPGSYKVPRPGGSDFAISHWFDGFTTVHRFDLVSSDKGMDVSYTSYDQVDELIEHARKTGQYDGISFGQKRDPCDTFFRKFKTVFEPPVMGGNRAHKTNIGVAFRPTMQGEKEKIVKAGAKVDGRKLMTLTTDAASTKHFDADTLEPLGVTDQTALHPSLNGPISGTHAEHCPVTGDIFNYNLHMGMRATYRVFRASPKTGEVEILATISGLDVQPAYLHSLLLTENFVILCLWPAHFAHFGADILWTRNMLDALLPFDPKNKATWLVIDRNHGKGVVKKFTSPAFFCFHTINAWEEKRADGSVDVIAELFEFNNMEILHNFYYENMVSDEKNVDKFQARRRKIEAGIGRYRLPNVPLNGGVAKNSKDNIAERFKYVASPDAGELPRINPRWHLKQHRYVWGVTDRHISSFNDGIVKTDMETGTSKIWECQKHTPGEPIFVRNPNGKDEDDGIVLVVVLDGMAGTSYLLCLDARTMEELGRADVGRAVGFGFHGVHLPQAALK